MDFYNIKERGLKARGFEIYPDFKVSRSRDLMVRGKSFYAIWDEDKQLWSTDEYDVQRLVDKELMEYRNKIVENREDIGIVRVKLLSDFSSKTWVEYRNFLSRVSDNSNQLDTKLTFQNTEIKKKDYISKRLPYSLEDGSYEAFDEIVGTLYEPEERAKLEWAIGSIIAGEGKDIQKFIVLYGEAGAGKSTMLNIIQKLFIGYYTTFEAKALTSSSNAFSTEVFRSNPLVAIQHDGDLSRIEDNTKLNSIISHEDMTMNEKYKPSYTAKANCFLFMATNQPVKISDAKSGIIRRLIDVRTSGKKLSTKKYFSLMSQIDFELGAIAFHCLKIYREMGKNYYSSYKPLDMMFKTDVFFNFVEENYQVFKDQNGVSLSQAYTMYKAYCDDALIEFKLPRHKFRDELKNYFNDFISSPRRVEGKLIRSYYSGFIISKFVSGEKELKEELPSWLVLDTTVSIFDEIGSDFFAQYATEKETPSKKWSSVTTHLLDINTSKVHYVRVPINHIVIDFDIKDAEGKKSPEQNLEAASKWPPTYAEYSKSQSGLHLHYIYEGDTSRLSNIYSEGIEVKVFNGEASLRRKLSKCNTVPIATIKSGLPLKGEKMINGDVVKTEKGLRDLILRNLKKEIHPGTKPSIDFIDTILQEACESGMHYDITDLRPKILYFASNSTHQAEYCIKLVSQMKFKSEEISINTGKYNKEEIVFFDVEVFPNLLLVCWKYAGEDKRCVHMVNPTSQEIETLFSMKLVGFNCRRFDNHILYARYIGYNNDEIYKLTKRIIEEDSRNGLFGEAYGISYTDIYDFSSIKQSLKKFQIQLGIHHQELGLPFGEDVSDENLPLVIDYCDNDVISEEAVFNSRKEDFVARQILADLSGLTVNDTTQQHTAKIIFGYDSKPQSKFVYTDLSERFPGYRFENGKSIYREEFSGEGGYVYAEPGYYENVALLDVASMHPTSIELLNLFGPYTEKFSEIKAARIAIKHQDYDLARKMLGGILEKHLTSNEESDALANALKVIINIVYGLTTANFSSKFKDPRNVDNIVAKRGALFMIDLKHAVQEKGFVVAHIKTDSVKIPNATQEIIEFVKEFGKQYGYTFEHEATFDKLCLINDAVYIAKNKDGKWTAIGAQFAHPYTFKTLFSKEPITFNDMCETKTVTSYLYLDMNEQLAQNEHNYCFIGRAGSFCPIKSGYNGGLLMRKKDDKYYAVTGSKKYRWLESEIVKNLKKEEDIDSNYYRELVDDAISAISKFVDFYSFRS